MKSPLDHFSSFPKMLWAATLVAMSSLIPAISQPTGVKLARPTAQQAAWQDLELGMFIHYDMPVFKPGWNHRQYEQRPEPNLFNPTKLNTDQWMEAAKAMGAKYAVFVAKHGSGFMCWQSDLYPFGMKQSPYKNGQGDIVRDFVNSCRKYGIQPGIYAHMGCNGYLEVDNPGLVNRGKGGDPDKQARYARICEGMLTELWGNYGKLTEIWFDGGVLDRAKGGPDMLPILQKLQPKAIVFQGPAASIRWIGNEDGVAPYPCWATVPDVRDYSGPGSPDGQKWLPGECDVPIRQGIWMWEPNTEGRLNSVNQLMDQYYRSVGHNCNLLLNANPDPDGLIPEPDMKRYQEFGDEIRRRFSKSVAETTGHGELVELALGTSARIDHVITMENIVEGERVREYVIEGLVGDQWKELCRGTSIGHKKIDQFSPAEVSKVRWRCTKSVSEPRIRRLAAYSVSNTVTKAQSTTSPEPGPSEMQSAKSEARQYLTIETNAVAITYTSPWLKASFALRQPRMTFLSVDSTGESRHKQNLLKEPIVCGPVVSVSGDPCVVTDLVCQVAVTGNVVRYSNIRIGDLETDSLCFTVEPRAIKVEIERDIPKDYAASVSSPFRLMFDAAVTPVSPLGRLKELGKLQFPVLLHFPDWGSLLVRLQEQGPGESTWDFSLFRDFKVIAPGAVAGWSGMSPEYRKRMEKAGNKRLLQANGMHLGPEQIQLALHKARSAGQQQAGKQRLELSMAVTAIYPESSVVDADPKLIGIKRAWLNIFGFRADLGCLANNSTGDTCQFCMFCYADQARYTPPLFDDFKALDLVRIALDRYFDGFKGFEDHFQDVAPSTVIAAWDYATGKPDPEWLKRRISSLEKYADRMIAVDVDGDGLCESERDPTNWWDCTPWNWKDAYSSALSWRAFRCLADLELRLGNQTQAKLYRDRADKIKAVYYETFYNPETGVLAGWRLKDGRFGDSYFLWVNGIAISFGLVSKPQANAILDRLQAKIKEVGFSSFQYGLPGNLVWFENKAGLKFQYYENGGVTGSMAYHYIQALYSVGRKAEADAIFDRMLEGYREGTFQNGIGGGGDWKEWDGSPCGYEGLLVDAYYPLTVFVTGCLGRGIPIP